MADSIWTQWWFWVIVALSVLVLILLIAVIVQATSKPNPQIVTIKETSGPGDLNKKIVL